MKSPSSLPKIICIPRIGAISLIWVRRSGDQVAAVSFDSLPRYAKAVTRWLRVPEGAMLRLYAEIAGVPVSRAAPEFGVRGSAHLNLEAMKLVSRIVLRLAPDIGRQGWSRALGQLLGHNETVAYFQRQFSHHDIWPQVKAVALTLAGGDDRPTVVLWSPLWPDDWRRTAEMELRSQFGVEVAALPRPYRWAAQRGALTLGLVRAFVFLAGTVLRHAGRPGAREDAFVATELIDLERLRGGPADTNFLEDGLHVPRDSVVYFLTRNQARLNGWRGTTATTALETLRSRGFRVTDLRGARYSSRSVRMLAKAALALCRSVPRIGAACLGSAFNRGCQDAATYLLLFDTASVDVVLHTFSPNGRTGLRFDSAALTGTARRFGSLSVGYQNRITYDSVYEDSFDCYDAYLAWGDGWRGALADAGRGVGRIVPIGCTENDGLRPRCVQGAPLTVAVFTAELEGTLPTLHGAIELIRTCCELARSYPECQFEVKTRDPGDVERLLADSDARTAYARAERNLRFLRLQRGKVRDLIDRAGIVIATTWTTPGGAALALEKRVIYYDVIGAGGTPFAGFSSLVARSPSELAKLFERALTDYRDYGASHRDLLDRLDPFRDGLALTRMHAELLRLTGRDPRRWRSTAEGEPNGQCLIRTEGELRPGWLHPASERPRSF